MVDDVKLHQFMGQMLSDLSERCAGTHWRRAGALQDLA